MSHDGLHEMHRKSETSTMIWTPG